MSNVRIFMEVMIAMSLLFVWSFAIGAAIRRVLRWGAPLPVTPMIEAARPHVPGRARPRTRRPYRLGERKVAGVQFSRAASQRRGMRAHAVYV